MPETEPAGAKVLWGVGETLRWLRVQKGRAQTQIDGVSATAISRIERDEDLPNLSTVDRILKSLGVGFDEFLESWRQVRGEIGGDENPPRDAPSQKVAADGEEVYLVWRLKRSSGREPEEVERQIQELVETVDMVRDSLKKEVRPNGGTKKKGGSPSRRRPK